MSDLFTTSATVSARGHHRTGKEQLIELADAVLSRDQSDVSDARSILSNKKPTRGRISQAGVSPSRAKVLLSKLENRPCEMYSDLGVHHLQPLT